VVVSRSGRIKMYGLDARVGVGEIRCLVFMPCLVGLEIKNDFGS
jgi:hypothetical protein